MIRGYVLTSKVDAMRQNVVAGKGSMVRLTKADSTKLKSYQTMAYIDLRPIDVSWHHKRLDAFEAGFADFMKSPAKRHEACMIGVENDIARESRRRDEKQATSEHYAKHGEAMGGRVVAERFATYAIEHEAKRVKLEALRDKLKAIEPEALPLDVLTHDYTKWPK